MIFIFLWRFKKKFFYFKKTTCFFCFASLCVWRTVMVKANTAYIVCVTYSYGEGEHCLYSVCDVQLWRRRTLLIWCVWLTVVIWIIVQLWYAWYTVQVHGIQVQVHGTLAQMHDTVVQVHGTLVQCMVHLCRSMVHKCRCMVHLCRCMVHLYICMIQLCRCMVHLCRSMVHKCRCMFRIYNSYVGARYLCKKNDDHCCTLQFCVDHAMTAVHCSSVWITHWLLYTAVLCGSRHDCCTLQFCVDHAMTAVRCSSVRITPWLLYDPVLCGSRTPTAVIYQL